MKWSVHDRTEILKSTVLEGVFALRERCLSTYLPSLLILTILGQLLYVEF